MTEAEWILSNNVGAMLSALKPQAEGGKIDRKLRLFACACVRDVWHLLYDRRSKDAVEIAEKFADGMADQTELDAAWDASNDAAWDAYTLGGLRADDLIRFKEPEIHLTLDRGKFWAKAEMRTWRAAMAAHWLTARKVGNPRTNEVYEGGAWVSATASPIYASDAIASSEVLSQRESLTESEQFYEDPQQSDLLRCVFGNPFRHAFVSPNLRTLTVTLLAQTIYDQRNFELMTTLGDALKDAGCTDELILAHCRGSEKHGRGCWVIDELNKKVDSG
jgi:hypothetical protein